MATIISGIIGLLFTAFIVFAVAGFFFLRWLGRGAAKVGPWVAVPLVLVGLLVIFPKLAPWVRKRWNLAADSVRPPAAPDPSTRIPDLAPNEETYVRVFDATSGEEVWVPSRLVRA